MRTFHALLSCLLTGMLLLPGFGTGAAQAATLPEAAPCPADAGWDTPSAPHHIHGSTWYVGTCGITALLVTSPQGHILLDGGTTAGGRLIEANIRALGFRMEDVRFIGSSHEHHDHVAGIAHLQQASGATVVARTPAAEVLWRGRGSREDPQFEMLEAFAPVTGGIRLIGHGQVLALGPLQLTAHATPAHAPGGTSWTWRSCADDGTCVDLAYVDSLTTISDDSWRFSDEAAHPGYVDTVLNALDVVAGLPCDILVTPHPAASDLWARIGPAANRPLAAPGACRAYAEQARQRLQRRLASEQADQPTDPAGH